MFRIKRLYSFLLGTFLPLLLATFSVCLFIMLMQWLWKYVDDLVGKGIEIKVLAELFFNVANGLVPAALPITILLASLMTFGNLGEHLELLAMKSSGISLLRIMKPLIVLIIFISGISLVYQNYIVPDAQKKFYTIMYSLRMKIPEFDIPIKTFYKEIKGYSLYVHHKDKTGLLRDVRIYDYSKSFDDAIITVSDSGRMKISDDKKYLIFTLYNGVSFGNLGINKSRYNPDQIPFQWQTFSEQSVLMEHNSNFNMADESIMQNRDVSKNIPSLRSFIRKASVEDDSLAQIIRPSIMSQTYELAFKHERSYPDINQGQSDTLLFSDFNLYFNTRPVSDQIRLLNTAKVKTERMRDEFNFQMGEQYATQRDIRGHKIELQKKFTYSLACLLFFFIGAPLGAIVRKGGIGFPAILSVSIFTLYYTVDFFGYKMARQGSWSVWEGMWFSSAVLLLLGIFLTYKAVNDSVVMNIDAWVENLLRIFGKRELRNYTRKEVIMVLPDYTEAARSMENWNEEVRSYLEQKRKLPFYISFWKQDFQDKKLNRLSTSMDQWIENLLNSNENLIIGKLMDYPIITPYHLSFFNQPAIRWSCFAFFPIGILIYIICLLKQKQIDNDLRITMKVNEEVNIELRNLNLVSYQ